MEDGHQIDREARNYDKNSKVIGSLYIQELEMMPLIQYTNIDYEENTQQFMSPQSSKTSLEENLLLEIKKYDDSQLIDLSSDTQIGVKYLVTTLRADDP